MVRNGKVRGEKDMEEKCIRIKRRGEWERGRAKERVSVRLWKGMGVRAWESVRDAGKGN